jgi:hypothetical protein
VRAHARQWRVIRAQITGEHGADVEMPYVRGPTTTSS